MADVDREPLAPTVEAYRRRLDRLVARGQALQESLAATPESAPALDALRVWQRDCAATIGQLSGGTKVHWLARAYSDALLVPDARAGSASVTTIVQRIRAVLDRARASLAQASAAPVPDPAGGAPPPQPRGRFPFISDEALRFDLERAYADGQSGLSHGEFAFALMTFCSILEAVITHALDSRGLAYLSPYGPPPEPIASWPFATRIAIAERARLISGGCARLPDVAREYRALLNARGELPADVSVSQRDAKVTSQVLHVILRDLAPGR